MRMRGVGPAPSAELGAGGFMPAIIAVRRTARSLAAALGAARDGLRIFTRARLSEPALAGLAHGFQAPHPGEGRSQPAASRHGIHRMSADHAASERRSGLLPPRSRLGLWH